ncbi:Fe(3+) ABC transporter substrate-binding protein [Palleronia sp. LCG004]|uniref:Fe(3+) ABC transporter substrate-binding protein n=1 Tax=Palleronia sp. LCG004 TaxID=3079304 RepID=UPI002943B228|nr:Fe(3+) ABC transporter substrate-binding protein [Palleronia sp. LCG004]WOI57805.1 Fe(3+) ABC transporter substrate-binding protein [Palleronia sp. LCG004]
MTRMMTVAAALLAGLPAAAQDGGELNLYSSRHYDTDEQLYDEFEEQTGITINRIEADADELIARMEAEGANSPADVFITVDTSRLERAKDAGLLQSVESDVLERRIPDSLQDADNEWFGFSQRARIIFYNPETVENPPMSYEELADDAYEGMICIRSSTNVYNQTLMAALIEHLGVEEATAWAEGVVGNLARSPQGGDTDQLRGIASGECDIAVANTYYFARALSSDVEGLENAAETIAWVFPNQSSTGAHMNLSGGGVAANAPNRDNAVAFLEYLASPSAQEYFSAGNNEYPAVSGVAITDAVARMGFFRPDDVNLSAVAANLPEAQRIFNEVGWE